MANCVVAVVLINVRHLLHIAELVSRSGRDDLSLKKGSLSWQSFKQCFWYTNNDSHSLTKEIAGFVVNLWLVRRLLADDVCLVFGRLTFYLLLSIGLAVPKTLGPLVLKLTKIRRLCWNLSRRAMGSLLRKQASAVVHITIVARPNKYARRWKLPFPLSPFLPNPFSLAIMTNHFGISFLVYLCGNFDFSSLKKEEK